MIVPEEVRRRFQESTAVVELLAKEVQQIIFTFCSKNLYAFMDRRKTLESLVEKLESGRFAKWSDVDDLYACTVIIPTLREESEVLAFLNKAFNVRTTSMRGSTRKDPLLFRFDNTRIRATLKTADPSKAALPLYNTLFEIQIRTAYEHAWSVSTHALVYKSDEIDWRKLRIAAQMKAIVEQLDLMSLAFDQLVAVTVPSTWPDIEARKKVVDRYKEWFESGSIPAELAPKDWTRFAENIVAFGRANGVNRNDLDGFIDRILSAVKAEVEKYNKTNFPRTVSLAQFTFGVLRQDGTLNPRLRSFAPLITTELVQLFPAVAASEGSFDLNS